MKKITNSWFYAFIQNAYLSGQGCSNHIYHGGIAYIANPGSTEKGHRLALLNGESTIRRFFSFSSLLIHILSYTNDRLFRTLKIINFWICIRVLNISIFLIFSRFSSNRSVQVPTFVSRIFFFNFGTYRSLS